MVFEREGRRMVKSKGTALVLIPVGIKGFYPSQWMYNRGGPANSAL